MKILNFQQTGFPAQMRKQVKVGKYAAPSLTR